MSILVVIVVIVVVVVVVVVVFVVALVAVIMVGVVVVAVVVVADVKFYCFPIIIIVGTPNLVDPVWPLKYKHFSSFNTNVAPV